LPALIELHDVSKSFGSVAAVRGVSLTLEPEEALGIVGPNGAGKTTVLRTATGVVRPRSGRVLVDNVELTRRPTHEFVRRGVCHLPEGRGIFPSLTVKENLTIQARGRPLRDAVAEATELFPVLGSRLSQTAGSLSGGEQQMLALSRAYITSPSIVLADEASLGLAPLLVDKIYEALAQLVERGLSVVVVEQYVQKALDLATTVYILSRGEVIHRGGARELSTAEIYERYLGIDPGS
jgi:branched-chain amino acid transport system ATP-binding protein